MSEYIDFCAVVRGYRKVEEPVVRKLSDVNRFPNDVLLAYAIEDRQLSEDEITRLLQKEIEARLEYQEYPVIRLPTDILNTLTPRDEMRSLAAYLTVQTEKIAIGFDDQLIFAKGREREYEFLNGEIVPYTHLYEELSANVPITTIGFCTKDERKSRYMLRKNAFKIKP